MREVLSSARVLAGVAAHLSQRPDNWLVGAELVKIPMNGGEPEAGSEFANRAAAAGEVRRPGFGVTVYHLQGIRAWPGCARKIILVLSILQCLFQISLCFRAKKGFRAVKS